jgi:hypothetical protein
MTWQAIHLLGTVPPSWQDGRKTINHATNQATILQQSAWPAVDLKGHSLKRTSGPYTKGQNVRDYSAEHGGIHPQGKKLWLRFYK